MQFTVATHDLTADVSSVMLHPRDWPAYRAALDALFDDGRGIEVVVWSDYISVKVAPMTLFVPLSARPTLADEVAVFLADELQRVLNLAAERRRRPRVRLHGPVREFKAVATERGLAGIFASRN